MSGYGVNDFKPKDLYLGGRHVVDLSRLREKAEKGPTEADFQAEDKVSIGKTNTPREKDQWLTLTVLHTNDMHGNIVSHKVSPEESGHQKTLTTGGQADMGTIIERERNSASDKGENFLLLDAGDMAMGTSLSGMFEGKPMMEIMNKHGYDAAALGNHDFDWGLNGLQDMKKEANFPFLSSNILDQSGKPLPNIQPFIIKEIPGMKVGIVGVTTKDVTKVATTDEVKNLQILDQIEVLKRTIPEMKKQGAQLIIVLSHSGLKMDKEIAKKVKGINLLIGGHSHDNLNVPLRIRNTMVVQAGHAATDIGKVQITWNPKKKTIVKMKGRLITNNADRIRNDKQTTSIINYYQKRHSTRMNTKIGKTNEDLIHLKEEGGETQLGNLVTDMMRKEVGAEIGMINSGSIRTNIKQGSITNGEIYNMIPFPSKIAKMRMTGKDLKTLLEQSAGREKNKVLQISGLRVVYDSSSPEGGRIKKIETEKGMAIEPDREYTIATTDFLAGGGDYYPGFLKGKVTPGEGPGLRDTITKRVKRMNLVSSAIDGRFQDVA